jgi:hypothetical protein
MNNQRSLQLLAFVSLFLVVTLLASSSFAQQSSTPLSKVENAYVSVRAAERAGYNVTSLDASLNNALGLITQGTAIQASDPAGAQLLFNQSEAIASQVATSAQGLTRSGVSPASLREAYLVGGLVAIGVAMVLVFFFLPTLFWRVWTRTRADSVVFRK